MTPMEGLVNKVLHQEPGEHCHVYSILLTITEFGVKSPLSFKDCLYRNKIEMKAGE